MSNQTWLKKVDIIPPEGWGDRTIMAFSEPITKPDGDIPANMTLTRDLRQLDTDDINESLKDYCDRQRITLENSLPNFALERQRTSDNGKYPAAEILFSWESGKGRIKQWLIYLLMPDHSIVSFTATCLISEFAKHEKVFQQFIWSANFDIEPSSQQQPGDGET